MRKFLAVLAFAVVPMVGTASLSACASFTQPQAPKTPRQYVADAEIALIGSIEVVSALRVRGYISAEQTDRFIREFERIGGVIDTARALISVGDATTARTNLLAALDQLSAIALQLSQAAENYREGAPPPVFAPATPTAFPAEVRI